jgi:DNA-binding transcriptional LysR family regulator
MSAPLDWTSLQVFLEVARRLSFTAAGSALDIHHTTVARRVNALEQTLSSKLVQRTSRGVQLTAAGEVLLDHLHSMDQAALAARRAVAGQDIQLQGVVRFTTTTELQWLVLPLLRTFQDRYPAVELRVDTSYALRSLAHGEADVALRAGTKPPDEAIAHRIAPVGWALYRHRDLGPDTSWIDLRGLPDLWPEGPPPRRVEVTAIDGAIQATRLGLGTGTLPCLAGELHPELVRVSEKSTLDGHALWLLVHADLRRVVRVRALVDHLREGLAKLADTIAGVG